MLTSLGTIIWILIRMATLCVGSSNSSIVPVEILWYAPFYSGGGYSSEAIAMLQAMKAVNMENISISQHGDTYRTDYVTKLTLEEHDLLNTHDISLNSNALSRIRAYVRGNIPSIVISICHSEPGAWHAPYPFYHTVQCPPFVHSTQQKDLSKGPVIYSIGRTMFETDRLPNGWAERMEYMDETWVPTQFAKDIFIKSGVPSHRLTVIGEPVDTVFYSPRDIRALSNEQLSQLRLSVIADIPPSSTVFLFVGKFEERKGIDILIEAYIREFQNGEDVVLLIVTSAFHSSNDFERLIRGHLNNIDGDELLVPLYHILEGIPQEGMPYLYSFASALVIPSHGEGWGRPHVEAMACATPVIATNWSGPTEFIRSTWDKLIDDVESPKLVEIIDNSLTLLDTSTVNCSATGFLLEIEQDLAPAKGWPGHYWAQPKMSTLQMLLRSIHGNPKYAACVGKSAREYIVKHYSLFQMGRTLRRYIDHIVNLIKTKL